MEIEFTSWFEKNITKLNQVSDRAAMKIMDRINGEAKTVTDDIIKKVETPKSFGREYRSRRSTRSNPIYHIASKPGYPPNPDTFHLADGIEHEYKRKAKEITISVHPKNEKRNYAVDLEYGTKRMEARPFFYNTVEKHINSSRFNKVVNQIFYAIHNDLEKTLIKEGSDRFLF